MTLVFFYNITYLSYLDPWDVLPARVVLCVGGSAVGGGAHAVLVVFADEDHGQLPESGHVDGFEELALIKGIM